MSLPAGIYFLDGVPTYARDDRGPYRVFYLETDARALWNLWAENQPRDRDRREMSIYWRAREAMR